MRAQGLGFAVAVAVASVGVSAEAAVTYTFQKVAETGANYTSLGAPSVNDLAVLAFQGVAPAAGRGVYFGTPLLVQRLVTPNLNVTASPYPADAVGINNVGQISFTALPPTNPGGLSGIDGVYRYNPGGTITTIADPWTRLGMISAGPVVNDSGRTAFTVWNAGNKQIVVGDGTAAATNTTVNGSGLTPDVHVSNDAHTVVALTGGASDVHAVLRDGTTLISETSPSYTDPGAGFSGMFRVSRTDAGDGDRVVFSASWGGGFSGGIYVWQGGAISKVAGSGAGASDAVVAINDLGTVAALVHGAHDRLSIYKDGVEGTLVSVGDTFDGSTITGLKFLAEGFNDLEQFAFNATLADGRSMNVLASPVPEPGTLGAVLVLSGTAVARRRRGR